MDPQNAAAVCRLLAAHPAVIPTSQQHGDSELTSADKEVMLLASLQGSPGQFLRRWGALLPGDMRSWFIAVDDYETTVVLRGLQRSAKSQRAIVRNRRYRHMVKMEESQSSSFFSDEEMKARCPWLFEQFVGQHVSHDEAAAQANALEQGSWLKTLLHQMDGARLRAMLEADIDLQSGRQEEEESESEGEREVWEMEVQGTEGALEEQGDGMNLSESAGADMSAVEDVPAEERARLRLELLQLMRERFLRGDDKDFFDYSTIDYDERLDDAEQIERDAEEAYFDEDQGYLPMVPEGPQSR